MSRDHSVLLGAIQVPSPDCSADGQANYLAAVVPALVEKGWNVEAVGLRFGVQPALEEGAGWRIHRVSPTESLPDVFAAYEPLHFRAAVQELEKGVLRQAATMGHC